MKELAPEEGKKPKTYRFARLGLSELYEALLKRTGSFETENEAEEEHFIQEMHSLRAAKSQDSAEVRAISQTQSISRLVRRVKVAVKRLAGRKIRQSVKRFI